MNKCFYCVAYYRMRKNKKSGYCVNLRQNVKRSQNSCKKFQERRMPIEDFERMRNKKK